MGGRAGAPALPGRDRRPAADVGLRRGEQGGVRGVRGHDAARRGALDRRGVPRRPRAASGSPGTPVEIAARLRRDVLERVGLPITVGVARTKFLAKVASGVAKPDGLLVVPPDGELAFLHPLPVERLWGVGPVTAREAPRARDHDGRRGRRSSREPVARRRCSAGPSGRHLHALAHNRDPRPVRSAGGGARSARSARSAARRVAGGARRRRSSRSSTASRGRMRAARRVGRTVVLRLRFDDFSRATRSHTLPRPTAQTADDPRDRARAARRGDAADRAQGLTLVGVAVATSTTTSRSSSCCRSTAAATRARRGARRGARPLRPDRSRAPCCSAATRGSRCRCCRNLRPLRGRL